MPEHEVFKGVEELRNHSKKHHYVCDYPECMMLVFEDGLSLSAHSWDVHKQKKEVKLEFGFGVDSDEER